MTAEKKDATGMTKVGLLVERKDDLSGPQTELLKVGSLDNKLGRKTVGGLDIEKDVY